MFVTNIVCLMELEGIYKLRCDYLGIIPFCASACGCCPYHLSLAKLVGAGAADVLNNSKGSPVAEWSTGAISGGSTGRPPSNWCGVAPAIGTGIRSAGGGGGSGGDGGGGGGGLPSPAGGGGG
uniref:Uncharacterized protein n=1 Tax=Amphimedon queenslandica TaxID=400682 RepID=A0A1X7TRG1_AMPQE